jgi:cysteine desulfurase
MLAADAALTHQTTTAAHTTALAATVLRTVSEALPDAQRLGHPDRALPHILSLRLPGIVGQTLLERCNARGVAFSTGSACHGAHHDGGRDDGKTADNHVLAAIGFDRRAAREVIRLSFSRENTTAEVARAARVLVEEARLLRQLSPRFGSEGSLQP